MITLRQLRYFEALARCLHFGQAAQDCAVTQPALSMQIKELEQNLGVVLIERQTSRIALTPSGEDVLKRVHIILDALRDLETVSQKQKDGLGGVLRLGVIPTVAPYLLPKALPDIKKQFPDLKLKIRESLTETLLQELQQNQLDLAVLALPVFDTQKLVSYNLFEDRFLLASPREMALEGQASDGRIDASKVIQSGQLLLLEDGHCLRDQALNFCYKMKVDTLSTFGATSLTTLVHMVASGDGMTLLPELAQSSEMKTSKHVQLSRFSEPEPFRIIGMVWRKSSPLQLEYEKFAEMLKKIGLKILKENKSK